jgi:hypothetical protein
MATPLQLHAFERAFLSKKCMADDALPRQIAARSLDEVPSSEELSEQLR